MIDRRPLLVATIALCVAGLLFALIIALGGTDRIALRIPEIVAAIVPAEKPAPRTTVQVAACLPPTELEQMHVATGWRDGVLVAECVYLGSRGTYRRSRHGMPEPRP